MECLVMDLSNFNIIWIESCEYLSEIEIPKHSHEFFHFIYVAEGMGDITIGEKRHSMSAGNIYLVPSFTNHAFFNRDKTPLKTLEIKFTMNNSEAEETIKNLPFRMSVKNYPVKSILLTIFQETFKRRTMSEEIIKLNFQLLIVYLLRCHDDIQENLNCDKSSENFSSEIDMVISYIYENLAEDMSLDDLAGIAGFEKNYFLRKFKKRTKQTPMAFIRDKRIEKAKELLLYSDMNISQIAIVAGFKTIHYFSKVFYENTGVRPLNYRNEKCADRIM